MQDKIAPVANATGAICFLYDDNINGFILISYMFAGDCDIDFVALAAVVCGDKCLSVNIDNGVACVTVIENFCDLTVQAIAGAESTFELAWQCAVAVGGRT